MLVRFLPPAFVLFLLHEDMSLTFPTESQFISGKLVLPTYKYTPAALPLEHSAIWDERIPVEWFPRQLIYWLQVDMFWALVDSYSGFCTEYAEWSDKSTYNFYQTQVITLLIMRNILAPDFDATTVLATATGFPPFPRVADLRFSNSSHRFCIEYTRFVSAIKCTAKQVHYNEIDPYLSYAAQYELMYEGTTITSRLYRPYDQLTNEERGNTHLVIFILTRYLFYSDYEEGQAFKSYLLSPEFSERLTGSRRVFYEGSYGKDTTLKEADPTTQKILFSILEQIHPSTEPPRILPGLKDFKNAVPRYEEQSSNDRDTSYNMKHFYNSEFPANIQNIRIILWQKREVPTEVKKSRTATAQKLDAMLGLTMFDPDTPEDQMSALIENMVVLGCTPDSEDDPLAVVDMISRSDLGTVDTHPRNHNHPVGGNNFYYVLDGIGYNPFLFKIRISLPRGGYKVTCFDIFSVAQGFTTKESKTSGELVLSLTGIGETDAQQYMLLQSFFTNATPSLIERYQLMMGLNTTGMRKIVKAFKDEELKYIVRAKMGWDGY